MRIVVADDVSLICELYARWLRRQGYEAYPCCDATLVVELVRAVRPDVVLLDINMPEVDGLMIAEQLRSEPDIRPQRLIAITGFSDLYMSKKIADAGFDRHLVKPVDWTDLADALTTQIAHR